MQKKKKKNEIREKILRILFSQKYNLYEYVLFKNINIINNVTNKYHIL